VSGFGQAALAAARDPLSGRWAALFSFEPNRTSAALKDRIGLTVARSPNIKVLPVPIF
jgi:hypothetical protein